MYDDYSLEVLISAIKSQEVIWNTKLRDYNNIEKKNNAWKIVCTQVIDDFNEKHELLKNVITQVLKKEWKVLKYGYFRFAKVKPALARADKHYVYRQQLSFLKTIMHSSPGRTRTNKGSNFTNISRENKRKSNISEEDEETENLSKRLRPELLNNSEDEDRMFLLSLVRDFNKIDDQYKLDARSEIINVIKYYRGLPHPTYETEFKNDNSNSSYISSRNFERRHHSPLLVDDPLPTQFNGSSRSPRLKRE